LAAFFDGSDTNDATQGGEFMRRLRPLTKIGGLPTVVVAAHPIKNAPEAEWGKAIGRAKGRVLRQALVF
jgi:hypothetical protein